MVSDLGIGREQIKELELGRQGRIFKQARGLKGILNT